jgi:hypothetical protein
MYNQYLQEMAHPCEKVFKVFPYKVMCYTCRTCINILRIKLEVSSLHLVLSMSTHESYYYKLIILTYCTKTDGCGLCCDICAFSSIFKAFLPT